MPKDAFGLSLYDRNEMLDGGTDEWTRKINTYQGLPFSCPLVQREAANRYKPVQGENPGSHSENEENWNEWVICKHLQNPAKSAFPRFGTRRSVVYQPPRTMRILLPAHIH
jgi:hypothetical protein